MRSNFPLNSLTLVSCKGCLESLNNLLLKVKSLKGVKKLLTFIKKKTMPRFHRFNIKPSELLSTYLYTV